MKKILVTGYTGFIGSHLINSFKKNYEIFGLSRNKDKNSDVTQIEGDIRDITIKKIPKKLDAIIHLAAMTDVLYCQQNPVECFDVNVNGTQNMLELARKLGTKFFYISTHHVYGKPTSLPVKEQFPPNPVSIYSSSKAAAELVCRAYASSYNMAVSSLRIFSVYGPNSPEHLVTNRLISQLFQGDKFEAGNLSPKRDFVYVTDVVNAIKKILQKSTGSNTFNIGTGKSYSIREICNILQKINNKKMTIHSLKVLSRKSDVPDIYADNSKIKKLGWKPQINFVDGLKLTCDWYSKQI